ncbi:MAG TPA: PIG-L family deacetylase [Clostridiales bacterium]|jgi:4-oxalomesaconate hydratase|nr:PIG-L family deacetylase [Clostridiales bacterium]
MFSDQRLLVVSAHSADWVWRSGGTIAKYLAGGAAVYVVCLTHGVRGESAQLWKDPDQVAENVRKIRSQEAANAAKVLGVTNLEMWDFNDCMLEVEPKILQKLNEKIRQVQPTLIITHDKRDVTNPDHGFASEIVYRAVIMAKQNGIDCGGLKPAKPCPVYGFEASEPERSGFVPAVYIDITDFFEKKLEAMKCIESQTEGPFIHTRLSTHRGWQASRTIGDKNIKYAEAFTMRDPLVVAKLPVRKLQNFN